jgi:hypothetical protein
MLAAVRYMIEKAASRESVILRILLESGVRVSEVLSLTAGGLRQTRNPQMLRLLDGSQRAFLVFERYPELREMPLVDWEGLSYWPAYSVLYGAASRHFARVQLAAQWIRWYLSGVQRHGQSAWPVVARNVRGRHHAPADDVGVALPPLYSEQIRATQTNSTQIGTALPVNRIARR